MQNSSEFLSCCVVHVSFPVGMSKQVENWHGLFVDNLLFYAVHSYSPTLAESKAVCCFSLCQSVTTHLQSRHSVLSGSQLIHPFLHGFNTCGHLQFTHITYVMFHVWALFCVMQTCLVFYITQNDSAFGTPSPQSRIAHPNCTVSTTEIPHFQQGLVRHRGCMFGRQSVKSSGPVV